MNEYRETPEDTQAWESLIQYVQSIPCRLSYFESGESEPGQRIGICAISLIDERLHQHFFGNNVVEAAQQVREGVQHWPKSPTFSSDSTAPLQRVMEVWISDTPEGGKTIHRSNRQVWESAYDEHSLLSLTAYERRN